MASSHTPSPSLSPNGSARPPLSVADAIQASYVAFLHRHPFATDAWDLGFVTGLREDYSYQADRRNVSLDVLMLDNDFHDADLDRYLDIFETHDPSIAVIGDAYDAADAHKFNDVAMALLETYPNKTLIIVPKCSDAFDILDERIVLGYPNGYSDLKPDDYSHIRDWRGRDIHILGGSPPTQWDCIQKLTQPTLTNDPPANIVGLDWNGNQKIAYKGEYWSRNGWQPADHLTIRETVREGLEEIKAFWQNKSVWPDTEPRHLLGPAVREPDELIFMDQGGDPICTNDALETAFVEQYEEGTFAFDSEVRKNFIEYREGLTPL